MADILKWHRLTDVDPHARTANCLQCGPVDIYFNGPGRFACGPNARAKRARPGNPGASFHRLSNVNAESYTADCLQCGPVDINRAGSNNWVCGPNIRARNARTSKRSHGLTRVEADEFKRDKRCEICNSDGNGEYMVVDHNASTKTIRGVLCSPCNRGIGMFKHDPDLLIAAAEYLRTLTGYRPATEHPFSQPNSNLTSNRNLW